MFSDGIRWVVLSDIRGSPLLLFVPTSTFSTRVFAHLRLVFFGRSGARFFSFWRVKILLLAPKAKFSRATFFETWIKKFSERKQSERTVCHVLKKVVDTRKGCEDRFPALLDLPFPLIRQILMPAYPEKRGRKTLVQLKKDTTFASQSRK